jgi:hypothetical protein
VDIILTGEAPVIEGWKLLARVEHLAGDNNLIHVAPGIEFDSTEYRTRRICDHCNTNVRRNDTVLITDGNEIKQIGRNCLADFCRSPEFANHVIEMGSWLTKARDICDEEERDMRRHCEREYKPVDVIAVAAAVIRDYGYQKKDSFNEPTVNRVHHSFLSDSDDKGKVKTEEQDQLLAVAALAWIADQEASSDYIRNLKILCASETVLAKHFGLMVSLPVAYARANDMLDAKKERPVSNYVGNIKDKITAVVRIEKLIAYETAYGFGDIVKMRDESGNLFVWFTGSLTRCETTVNGQIVQPIQEGDWVNLKGTVKGHDEYRNEKQTALTRCKLSPKSQELAVAS